MNQKLLYSYLMFLLTILIAAACGTAPPASPTATPSGNLNDPADNPALETAATAPAPLTAEPLPDTYPAPQLAAPAAPTHEPGYPPPPTFPPTVDPYPGGLVWIIRPVGVQCEDGTAPGYGDLQESVATLIAAGLEVASSEMTDIPVTAVCGSPTSAHYRVQINPDDLDTASAMGWERE